MCIKRKKEKGGFAAEFSWDKTNHKTVNSLEYILVFLYELKGGKKHSPMVEKNTCMVR